MIEYCDQFSYHDASGCIIGASNTSMPETESGNMTIQNVVRNNHIPNNQRIKPSV